MGAGLKGRRDRVFLMTKTCPHGRDASLALLQQNLQIARNFTPMTASEMDELRNRCKSYAADGRYELYKVSLKFDNPESRLAHGFPLDTKQIEVQDMLGSPENTGYPFPEKEF